MYIFNAKDFSVATASVTNVSKPHVPKSAQSNPALFMQGFQGLVVDVFLNIGAESTSIEFPVNSVSASYPEKGLFVSTDPMLVSREIENAMNNSKQFKAQLPYHDMVIEKGPSLIMQLNPQKQIEAQQAQRIATLEDTISKMYGRIEQMAGMLSANVPANHKTKKEE